MAHRQGHEDRVSIGVTGQDDSNGVGIFLFYSVKKSSSIHTRHAHVGYDGVEWALSQFLERRLTALREYHCHLATVFTQEVLKTFQDLGLVVNEQNTFHNLPPDSSPR